MKNGKFVLLVLVALLAVGLIAGCGPTAVIEPPTATPVPPTPTPIPPTPTPVPTPSRTDIITDAGFVESSQGISTVDIFGATQDSFVYQNDATLEFLAGFALQLDAASIAGFEVELTDPNILLAVIVSVLQGSGIEAKQPLDVSGIGDASNGVSFVTSRDGFPVRVDVVVFQRGNLGAVVALAYMDGMTPSVNVVDVARLYDYELSK